MPSGERSESQMFKKFKKVLVASAILVSTLALPVTVAANNRDAEAQLQEIKNLVATVQGFELPELPEFRSQRNFMPFSLNDIAVDWTQAEIDLFMEAWNDNIAAENMAIFSFNLRLDEVFDREAELWNDLRTLAAAAVPELESLWDQLDALNDVLFVLFDYEANLIDSIEEVITIREEIMAEMMGVDPSSEEYSTLQNLLEFLDDMEAELNEQLDYIVDQILNLIEEANVLWEKWGIILFDFYELFEDVLVEMGELSDRLVFIHDLWNELELTVEEAIAIWNSIEVDRLTSTQAISLVNANTLLIYDIISRLEGVPIGHNPETPDVPEEEVVVTPPPLAPAVVAPESIATMYRFLEANTADNRFDVTLPANATEAQILAALASTLQSSLGLATDITVGVERQGNTEFGTGVVNNVTVTLTVNPTYTFADQTLYFNVVTEPTLPQTSATATTTAFAGLSMATAGFVAAVKKKK